MIINNFTEREVTMVTDQTELRLDDDEAEENGAEEGGVGWKNVDNEDDNGADDAGDAEDATESD